MKIALKGIVIVAAFFLTWFGLTQINWVKLFKVEQATDKTEEKLGDLFWENIQNTEEEITNRFVTNTIDSVVDKVCKENDIERSHIKVHVLQKDEVNAFALPNGHLVIYSGLITEADKQEELSGVICHELAHIELNHVMKKLVRELGFSVLVSITTGNGGGDVIKQATKMLSSSAFDRKLEKEADIKAVDYLVKAHINPAPFADFLYKLSDADSEITKYLSWVSTHPDSKERAEYIIEHQKDKKVKYGPVLADESWEKLKEKVSE